MNGNIKGNENGEIMYMGARSSSVIDYVLANTAAREKIDRMIVNMRTESDRLPIYASFYVLKMKISRRKITLGI